MSVCNITRAAHDHRDTATLLVETGFGPECYFPRSRIRIEQRVNESNHFGIRRDGQARIRELFVEKDAARRIHLLHRRLKLIGGESADALKDRRGRVFRQIADFEFEHTLRRNNIENSASMHRADMQRGMRRFVLRIEWTSALFLLIESVDKGD